MPNNLGEISGYRGELEADAGSSRAAGLSGWLYRLGASGLLGIGEPLGSLERHPVPASGEAVWLDLDWDAFKLCPGQDRGLELHPLILEGIWNNEQISSVQAIGRSVHIEFPFQDNFEQGPPRHLSVVFNGVTLITMSKESGANLGEIARRLQVREVPLSGLAALLHALLDHLSDHTVGLALKLRETVNALAQQFDDFPDSLEGRQVLRLKRQAGRLEATLEDQQVAIDTLIRLTNEEGQSFFSKRELEYWRSLRTSLGYAVLRVNRLIDRLGDLETGMRLHVQDKTGQRLNFLTMLSALFLPLTLVAGIYGMNFEYMPELGYRWAYPLVIGGMGGSFVGMLFYFRWRGWF